MHACFRVRAAPSLSRTRLVVLAQPLLDLGELALGLLDNLLEVLEALVVVGDVFRAVGALVGAEVLDLLAAVFDFGHAERGARAFEEVAERGQLCEVTLFAGGEFVSEVLSCYGGEVWYV